jgi:ATP-dependent protease ClpP protease subunit
MKAVQAKNDKGEGEDVGEVLIYGDIDEDPAWYGDTVTPKTFRDDLKSLGNIKHIHVHINSYGGYVSAGSAIYTILRQHPATVTTYIDGFALSAASVIAMAGDTIVMPGNAMMMIHNPSTYSFGNAEDLRHEADTLDKIRDAMVAIYREKTGLDSEEIIKMLDAETWFTADEAIENGFADISAEPFMAVAQVKPGVYAVNGQEFNLTAFENLPLNLKNKEMEEEKMRNSTPVIPAAPAPTANPEPQPITQPQPAPADNAAILAEAVKAERERMRALDELLVTGAEELIARAKYETGASAESVALEIIKAQKKMGTIAFEARKADAETSGVNDLGAAKTSDGIGGGDAATAKAEELRAAITKRREGK